MFHFLLQEAGCQHSPRPTHCDQRFLPEAGEWTKIPEVSRIRFREWILKMHEAFPPGHKDQHLFGSRSHGNERNSWFNASQISWMVDQSGARLVNDIFKLEELSKVWPLLQIKICGLSRMSYSDAMSSIKRNPSTHGHYSLYYDERTRAIIAEYMKADIDAFGYTFEMNEKRARE
eukprot:scaffold131934_cov29-Tisochrysis_lutea.AAC.3